MKKIMKSKKGITLISLVVTIIILLILAGISIGMLSGDNSIIKQAGNAKTQTDIAEEKEILEKATVVCMGKNKYGNIEEIDLKKELENVADVTLSGNKFKVTFPSERQYLIDQDGNVKEKNPNAMEISELYEGASTYFGWDVINYTETLDSSLDYMKWQLFYAGPLDGETEERIYLISKDYVKNTNLPTVIKNGVEVEGAKPIVTSGSYYKAKFGNSTNDGVMSQYLGSSDISTNMKKYNKSYFITKNYSSTNPNMKAVAYMLDTTVWRSFAASNRNYSELAIGGPTIELLFTAYNKYTGKTGANTYVAEAKSVTGYQVSNNNGSEYSNIILSAIDNDTTTVDSPYSVSNTATAEAYWLASTSNSGVSNMMNVYRYGSVYADSYSDTSCGFRPIVLLNSNYTLEKVKDSNGKDAFKIVEQ